MPGPVQTMPGRICRVQGTILTMTSLLLLLLCAQLIYVGSAESDQHDQLLDQVLVGPMQVQQASRAAACRPSCGQIRDRGARDASTLPSRGRRSVGTRSSSRRTRPMPGRSRRMTCWE